MDNHVANAPPPETPTKEGSPTAGGTVHQIGSLSIDHARPRDGSPRSRRERGMMGAATVRPNRSAHSQSPRSCEHAKARQTYRNPRTAVSKGPKKPAYDRHHFPSALSGEHLQRKLSESKTNITPFVQSHDRLKNPVRVDSGFCAMPSRDTTLVDVRGAAPLKLSLAIDDKLSIDTTCLRKDIVAAPADSRYPGLILQPDSSPISQEQLAAEVKSIYSGLVMVEAKCINIAAGQAADPKSKLGHEQWQALIALHRTLLYEHHDFLMATQHPSAPPNLRGLAMKYNMPARMWKHGIHAFLEFLRHRRPESQDYMLAFIYLAYQMMALLFETVPSFTDTWIECLGDLARYRMAIEEEKEAHATWGGVASRWYTTASDRHPAIGRLYHHLGILERPSLRKLCLYSKSLTCVIPFPNARDSLATLCGPIVQDEQMIQSSRQLAEARIVTHHALIYSDYEQSTIDSIGSHALELLKEQFSKLRDFGAYLAITNTSALFELGSPTNALFQHYTTAINQAMQNSRPSASLSDHRSQVPQGLSSASNHTRALDSSKKFWIDTFNLVLRSYHETSLKDSLSYMHVMLVFLHSLHSLRTRLMNGQHNTYQAPLDTTILPWSALAKYLNNLAEQYPISARVLECARQGVFLTPESKEHARPLPEDYLIRGLIWGQFLFRPCWFDGQGEDDGRAIETSYTTQARAERVLWLGLCLAFHAGHLQYDVQRRVFSASKIPTPVPEQNSVTDPTEVASTECEPEQVSDTPSPNNTRSSLAPSSSSNSDDGFHIVKAPRSSKSTTSPQQCTWAKVASNNAETSPPRKQRRPENNAIKVADEDGMVWSAGDEDENGDFRPAQRQMLRNGHSRA
ncbi:hypothetical protein DOTSEDRAFT_71170 [Lecanosticta acicola]|uniref:DNA/RNA-binding domain-containing protein n=1 Tax=Lecanosticta acicola TaxID=111012 RepID=A0AAI9EDU3_9PEZI|nr:hypothetical protein DOTSEDRAFT_71170 [Lecanosticta acicola]